MVLCSDVFLLGRDEVITSKLQGNGKPSTPVSQLYSPAARELCAKHAKGLGLCEIMNRRCTVLYQHIVAESRHSNLRHESIADCGIFLSSRDESEEVHPPPPRETI